jgi:hypothetical protein
MCADVVIVGGGPVGCWTAIQIKNQNPELEVCIYERYANYRRDNKLSIDRASFESHRKVMGDALEAQLFKDIASANNSAAHLEDSKGLRPVTHISTQDLERILKDHCEKRGIAFAVKAMETPEQVMELHPECQIFVGADGAHSKMRKGLLGEDDLYKKDLLHSLDVTYRVKGQAKYLAEPTYDKMDMIVVETVGREQNGETIVGLRFLVNQESFTKFPEATFKKPVFMDDYSTYQGEGRSRKVAPGDVEGLARKQRAVDIFNEMNEEEIRQVTLFREDLRKFQDIRKNFAGEELIEASETVTKIKLSQYASKKFAMTVDNQSRRAGWFLVGDAAMGVPFYRSVNIGLKMGSQLGAVIGGNDFSTDVKAKLYNAIRPLKLASEFGLVAAKLGGINAYKTAVRPALRVLGAIGLGVVAVPLFVGIVLYSKINPRARIM